MPEIRSEIDKDNIKIMVLSLNMVLLYLIIKAMTRALKMKLSTVTTQIKEDLASNKLKILRCRSIGVRVSLEGIAMLGIW